MCFSKRMNSYFSKSDVKCNAKSVEFIFSHFVHGSWRCLSIFYWMATGPWMLETGSGSQRVPSSTSTSEFTPLSHLARRQTKMEITSSKTTKPNKLKLSQIIVIDFTFPLLDRKYLPLLKKFPAQYIYEPWKAPRSVQQAAGCIVGKDYPQPIVQHEVISKKNIQRMKLAYAKRSADSAESPNESPSKKQGTARNVYLSQGFHSLAVSHVYIMSCLFNSSLYSFLLGVKRKAKSVIDMLQKKDKKE